MRFSASQLKEEILRLTREYSRLMHRSNRPGDDSLRSPFAEGDVIPYAGRVFTEDEVEAAVGATLDFWLTLGNEGEAFEHELADFMGVKHTLLVNSGSSANLLAVSALTSHKLPKEKRLSPSDEVITCAAGFPTTVAPIIQNRLVPVFIDNDPVTGNARTEMLESAYVSGKTKAVMMAHTLGNPFDLRSVLEFCAKYDLWLIEDNCDALGCTYSIPKTDAVRLGLNHLIAIADKKRHSVIRYEAHPVSGELLLTAPTGSWGDLSTQSFYPPHHLTMGEGGAVNIIRDRKLKTIVESYRDWGRDCWCASGKDNTCKKRFGWKLGELPEGYDHKYIYSHLGYNLKPLDPQAAIGRQQLKKLGSFIEARKINWEILRKGLELLSDYFEFTLPTHTTKWTPEGFEWDDSGCKTDCSWFGFMLRTKSGSRFNNSQLARHLDIHKIGNRMLFGGNLVKQPAFVQLKKDHPNAFRVVGNLDGANEIMNCALFLGTYPGLTVSMLEYEIDILIRFIQEHEESNITC